MLVITTAKTGHHIHRDTCPRITPKVNPTPAAEADPDAVLEARACSRCSPRESDIGRAIADAEARKVAPKATPDAPQATERPAADTGTHQRCTGACGRDLPIQKFPTTRKGRGTECRECRDARWAANKAPA